MAELAAQGVEWIPEHQARIIEISDLIWEYAEVGLQEYRSSKLLADELENHGFVVERGVAGMPTAFIATAGSGRPVIGFMGEYDALPGLSQKPIAKQEPVIPGAAGHGCGHNLFGASSLAAALATKVVMEEHGIPGTVKYFGCPAEELGIGKVYMVRDGLFDGVDAALCSHPGMANAADLLRSNAMNSVKFHFHGSASHAAAAPDQGRSALDAVEIVNIGLNYLREHVVQEARMHYIIEDGGRAPNIVPAYARAWYLVRAPERWQVEIIYNRLLDIAKGADLITGTTHTVEFVTGCYNKIPNETLCRLATEKMREVGVPEYTDEELAVGIEMLTSITYEEKTGALMRSKRPDWEKLVDEIMDPTIPDPWGKGVIMTGSTDIGDVSWKTPVASFWTAAYPIGIPGHSWQKVALSISALAHKSCIFAAKTLMAMAVDLLTKPDLLKQARKEFEETTGGMKYQSPLPPDAKPPIVEP